MNILHEMVGGKQGLIVMGGHESGIVTYGETLNEAGNILISIGKVFKRLGIQVLILASVTALSK